MYGLEKNKKQAAKKFDFDLEVDFKEHPQKAKKISEDVQKHVEEIKKLLKEGSKSENFEKLGTLLQGYTALQKVLNNIHPS